MAIERVSLLDSDNTLKVSDYDYSRFNAWLVDYKSWILFSNFATKPEFDLDEVTGTISAWSAVIICNRASSAPIQNEKIMVGFELSWDKEWLTVTAWSKIFIEIQNDKVQDPTLISDPNNTHKYSQWLSLGAVKSAQEWPSHDNYMKLWENDAWIWIDHRVAPIPREESIDLSTKSLSELKDWPSETPSNWQLLKWNEASGRYEPVSIDVWVEAWFYFGDWSDWDVTITTTVTLTRDMFYNNLTITSPGILNTNWYRVLVKWILSWNGTIQANGGNWGNWVTITPGSAGAINLWTLWVGVEWQVWGAVAVAWIAWTIKSPTFLTSNWWAGGNGWWWWIGWVGGSSSQWMYYDKIMNIKNMTGILLLQAVVPFAQYYVSGWAGSWGWWGSGWDNGGAWWWSWATGNMLFISAYNINFPGNFYAKWWNGWNGWNGSKAWWQSRHNAWGGWGWAGGNGGVIVRIYSQWTNLGTTSVAWWTGWAGGSWYNGGAAWTTGANWVWWLIIDKQF